MVDLSIQFSTLSVLEIYNRSSLSVFVNFILSSYSLSELTLQKLSTLGELLSKISELFQIFSSLFLILTKNSGFEAVH